MKIKNIITVLLLIIILVSCAPAAKIVPTLTFTPAQTATITDISSATPDFGLLTAYPNPDIVHPVLLSDQLLNLKEHLNSKDCVLPCYMEITPGLTSWDNAKKILEGTGARTFGGEYPESGLPSYTYRLDLGYFPKETVTPSPDTSSQAFVIAQSLQFTIKDGIVQRVVVDIESSNYYVSTFDEYFSKYSLRKILLYAGLPDDLKSYSDPYGYNFALYYKRKGIVIEYGDLTENNMICLEFRKIPGYLFLRMVLTNISSELPLLDSSGHVYPDATTEEMLGINATEFYRQIISDPNSCFRIKQLTHP